ncbi:MAG: flagellin [Lachnospiraceae bacterium]|nr:flagellin [Lachnospiraceae bacterium]
MTGITGAISSNYRNLSSGYRINSASDDAAGLSISEKMQNLQNAYDVGAENAEKGNGVLNVADGALSSIQDSLGRIRELGLQASNSALYSQDELSMMQDEIDQIMQGITDVAKNTQFNGLKLLDGSMATMDLATNPDGRGQEIKLESATLQNLGIEGFNVTGSFNLQDIDDAIQKVSDARSSIGAQSNRLDYTIASNQSASFNIQSANSSIRDADMAEEISKLKKNQILEQVQLNMQKKRQEEEAERKRTIIQIN